jgi:manganese/zinc/iron transport system permease protein
MRPPSSPIQTQTRDSGERGSPARPWRRIGAVATATVLTVPTKLLAQNNDGLGGGPVELPTFDELVQVLLLRDYNTWLVVLSTALLGLAAGLIGSFLLLRKRSLMGDVLSHATLPGVAFAFMAMVVVGQADFIGEWIAYFNSSQWQARVKESDEYLAHVLYWLGVPAWPSDIRGGKWLPGLLLGAALFSILGFLLVMLIRDGTRLKDDSAMGIVLSVTFGLGVALLGVAQSMPGASAAGLESFIYGKTASMIWRDFLFISTAAIVVGGMCVFLFKEFTLLCFDDGYAASQGWPVRPLDIIMLLLVTTVTVIGLQAVGLILIIALLLIPPAAARFWTDHLPRMLVLSGVLGALSGWLGSSLSALIPNLPAGAIIVVAGAGFFIISLIFGPARGVLKRALQHARLTRKIARQHLLRAFYEIREQQTERPASAANSAGPHASTGVDFEQLLQARSWQRWRLRWILRRMQRRGLVRETSDGRFQLTEAGLGEAAKVVRNHRLWEIYLLEHADVAPNHVDRDADQIEHVLPAELVNRLEQLLHRRAEWQQVPASPHAIQTAQTGGATGGTTREGGAP